MIIKPILLRIVHWASLQTAVFNDYQLQKPTQHNSYETDLSAVINITPCHYHCIVKKSASISVNGTWHVILLRREGLFTKAKSAGWE